VLRQIKCDSRPRSARLHWSVANKITGKEPLPHAALHDHSVSTPRVHDADETTQPGRLHSINHQIYLTRGVIRVCLPKLANNIDREKMRVRKVQTDIKHTLPSKRTDNTDYSLFALWYVGYLDLIQFDWHINLLLDRSNNSLTRPITFNLYF